MRWASLFRRRKTRDEARPRVAVLMMQKDEDMLLDFWIRYHADLFGLRNLTIFDNGSTRPDVLERLDRFERDGGTVERRCRGPAAFRSKGMVLLRRMRVLRRSGYRVFLPLDCDEFVALTSGDGYAIDFASIRAEVEEAGRTPAARVTRTFDNHPDDADSFAPDEASKVFGSFEGIDRLGCGYHSVDAPMATTSLCYVHYHNRPYPDLRARAAAKVAAHGHGLEPEALAAYAASRKAGRPNAVEVLMSETEYRQRLDARPFAPRPALPDWFRARCGRVPFQSVPAAAASSD